MTRFVGRLTLSLPLVVTVALSLLEPAVSAKPKGTLYPDTGCSSRIIVIDVYICMKQGQISGPTVFGDRVAKIMTSSIQARAVS